MSRDGEDSVSSVVGTILMLGVTVTVFGGFAVVALGYLHDQPQAPRSDLAVVQGAQSLLLTHKGGESFAVAGSILYVNVDGDGDGVGHEVRIPLTDTALAALTPPKSLAALGVGADWGVGDTLCVWGSGASCLYDPANVDVLGAFLVDDGRLLLDNGERGLPGAEPTTFADLTIALVSQSPVTPGPAQAVTWTVRVANGGSAATGAVPLVVRIEVDGAQVALATANGPLAVGATLDATGTPSWSGAAGTHSLRLTVDPAGAVRETNEGNNQAMSSFTVSTGLADPGQAYEDRNNDGLYGTGDLLLANSAVSDCVHSSTSGLVIPESVPAISAATCSFSATGNLVIGAGVSSSTGNVDLSGVDVTIAAGVTVHAQATLTITRSDDLVADGVTFLGNGPLRLNSAVAGQTGTTTSLVGSTIDVTAGTGDIQVRVASGGIDASNAVILSRGIIDVGGTSPSQPAASLTLSGAALDNAAGGTAITVHDAGAVLCNPCTLTAGGQLTLTASTLTLTGATMSSANAGTMTVTGTGAVAAGNAKFTSSGNLAITGVGVTLNGACTTTSGTDKTTTINAGTGALSATGPSVPAGCTGFTSSGHLTFTGSAAITLNGATLAAGSSARDVLVGPTAFCGAAPSTATSISATNAKITSSGRTCIQSGAAASVTLNGACITTQGTGNALQVTSGTATGTLLSATGPSTPAGCNGFAATGPITLTGTVITVTSARFATTGTAQPLSVTTGNGVLTATSVTASTTGPQTWKSSAGGGVVLTGSTLSATGSTLTACLPTSGFRVDVGSSAFVDSNNKLAAKRGTACTTTAYSSTYISPWNATTQGMTE